jgi:hypothetical protein
MKYSLLDLVQTILSSMDSDEVNSINDTTEAMQVANVVKSVYYDILTRADLPESRGLFVLERPPATYPPTAMRIPADYSSVEEVRYNTIQDGETDAKYTLMAFVDRDTFLDRMYAINETDDDVDTTTLNSVKYIYKTNVAPTYYTTFDDRIILFDSYDSAVDINLRPQKSLAYGKKSIPWSMANTFVPDLDDEQFALLLNEAKSLAWVELKQTPHQKAEMNARRGWTRLQRTKDSLPTPTQLERLPNYGRKRC